MAGVNAPVVLSLVLTSSKVRLSCQLQLERFTIAHKSVLHSLYFNHNVP